MKDFIITRNGLGEITIYCNSEETKERVMQEISQSEYAEQYKDVVYEVVDEEQLNKIKEEAETNKRKADIDNYMRAVGMNYRSGVFASEFRTRHKSDAVKITGFTQVKGRKHLSKKQRKSINH